MARKPNYGFEKRQKELARKAKKEEKHKRKQGDAAPEHLNEPSAGDETEPPAGEGLAEAPSNDPDGD